MKEHVYQTLIMSPRRDHGYVSICASCDYKAESPVWEKWVGKAIAHVKEVIESTHHEPEFLGHLQKKRVTHEYWLFHCQDDLPDNKANTRAGQSCRYYKERWAKWEADLQAYPHLINRSLVNYPWAVYIKKSNGWGVIDHFQTRAAADAWFYDFALTSQFGHYEEDPRVIKLAGRDVEYVETVSAPPPTFMEYLRRTMNYCDSIEDVAIAKELAGELEELVNLVDLLDDKKKQMLRRVTSI